MGTKKWAEIKKLSKATDADRAEARAELEAELGDVPQPQPRTIQWILDHADELAARCEASDPTQGREVPVDEYLARRNRKAKGID
jgi:hypothetical protein